MKIVGRGDTTVVDAYLSPILRAYVDRVAAATGRIRLMFMQSNGGLTDAHRFQGKDAILSGPAGGVVGAVKTSLLAGCRRIVGFDMGGTSTDVTHYAGSYERAFDTEVAGVRMRAPIMKIHTVAAGGGSIIVFDGQRFRVGPESAGANPGPASYRRGGPLTVTDANVMVGKILPELFPSVFGPDILGVPGTRGPSLWHRDPWSLQVRDEWAQDLPTPPTDREKTLTGILGSDGTDVRRWRSLWRRTDFLGFPVYAYRGGDENPIDLGATESAPTTAAGC